MKVFRVGLAALAAMVLVLAISGPAQAASQRVTVNPFNGLTGGDTVTVHAWGLPKNRTVDIVQCQNASHIVDGFKLGCDPRRTAKTDGNGALTVSVTLGDPVYFNERIGPTPLPLYCRLDGCRIFVEWTTPDNVVHSVGTRPMHFIGSIATIAVDPSENLGNGAKVHVSGTAKGSTGHFVTILEQNCFLPSGQNGCLPGTLPLVTLPLRADDSFSGDIHVFRFLGNGFDCAASQTFGQPCILTPVVLNADGVPDDSFGVSSFGQPAAELRFAS